MRPLDALVHNEKVQTDRVAIFGSGGQLGVELKAEFSQRGYAVTSFERADVDIHLIVGR